MFKRLLAVPVALLVVWSWSFAAESLAQVPPVSPASDQILSYASDITVHLNNTLLVRETIRVVTGGVEGKQAICRELPTQYSDRFGNPYTIHLEVVSLERDDQPDTFHLERAPNGLRVCLGSNREGILPGEHNYELTYKADREVGFFADYDELYWNVTGSGWTLPIQVVTATVRLPKGIAPQALLLDGYTGQQGAVGNDFTASTDRASNATFQTTRPLAPGEALTIVVRWPKNFVLPPTPEQLRQYWLEDHQPLVIGGVGLLVVLIYYLIAWFKVRKSPARIEIEPESEAPWGLSPVTIRYLWSAVFDRKAMVACLTDLAVKGRLIIQENAAGAFTIDHLRLGADTGSASAALPGVTADEKLIIGKLFAAGDTLRFEPANRDIVGGAMEDLHQYLRRKRGKVYLSAERWYLTIGLALSLALVIRCGLAIQGVQAMLLCGLALTLLPWSLGCVGVAVFAAGIWKDSLSAPYHVPAARSHALRASLLALLFWAGEAAGLWFFARIASGEVLLILLGLVLLNCLFHYLARSPKRAGSRMIKQIELFREFLSTVRQSGAAGIRPVTKVVDVSERFLPYAIALNVEKAWGEKFAAALELRARQTISYAPEWFSGPSWDPINAATFPSALTNSCLRAVSNSLRRG